MKSSAKGIQRNLGNGAREEIIEYFQINRIGHDLTYKGHSRAADRFLVWLLMRGFRVTPWNYEGENDDAT